MIRGPGIVGLILCAGLTAVRAGGAAAAEPLRYEKAYITRDATWSGTVIVRGQTVVRRGATLTVLPGTVVKFEWVDEDGDGIGDGELTVEGRLVARGTKENPIVFTSARENPRMKDWTFVQISMNRDAVVEYCIFEYAFSGLQVHFSTAAIRNNRFRRNFEGIRFSTSDAVIEHNDIVDNRYGIRAEAHGSRTTIRRNRFEGNESAFFLVRKNGDTLTIRENNVERTAGDLVKFGTDQKQDVDFSGNWWGTADDGEIAAKMLDAARDPSLGRVRFTPSLKGRVAECGVR